MRKSIWLEIPVRRNLSNASVIAHFEKHFASYSVDAVVFSDKAAGLDHFATAEEILSRGLVRDFIQATQTLIINVLRTGDRCPPYLDHLCNQLMLQGTSSFLFVSGHDFRTLKFQQKYTSERFPCQHSSCEFQLRTFPQRCGGRQSQDIPLSNKRKGGAIYSPEKKGFEWYITQVMPNVEYMQQSIPQKEKIILSVMPCLSLADVERFEKLVGNKNSVEIQNMKTQFNAFTTPMGARDFGLDMAKRVVKWGRENQHVSGFYIYSPDVLASQTIIASV